MAKHADLPATPLPLAFVCLLVSVCCLFTAAPAAANAIAFQASIDPVDNCLQYNTYLFTTYLSLSGQPTAESNTQRFYAIVSHGECAGVF